MAQLLLAGAVMSPALASAEAVNIYPGSSSFRYDHGQKPKIVTLPKSVKTEHGEQLLAEVHESKAGRELWYHLWDSQGKKIVEKKYDTGTFPVETVATIGGKEYIFEMHGASDHYASIGYRYYIDVLDPPVTGDRFAKSNGREFTRSNATEGTLFGIDHYDMPKTSRLTLTTVSYKDMDENKVLSKVHNKETHTDDVYVAQSYLKLGHESCRGGSYNSCSYDDADDGHMRIAQIGNLNQLNDKHDGRWIRNDSSNLGIAGDGWVEYDTGLHPQISAINLQLKGDSKPRPYIAEVHTTRDESKIMYDLLDPDNKFKVIMNKQFTTGKKTMDLKTIDVDGKPYLVAAHQSQNNNIYMDVIDPLTGKMVKQKNLGEGGQEALAVLDGASDQGRSLVAEVHENYGILTRDQFEIGK